MTYQKAVTSTQYYDEIANRIQTYGDANKKYSPPEMSNAIDGIVSSAVHRGRGEGLLVGEVQGRQKQNEEFWEQLLAPMNRGVSCPNFFCGTGWNTYTFYPTMDIKPKGNGSNMFNYFSQHVTPYMDMTERLEECGVIFDTSGVTACVLMFGYCFATRLPKLDLSNTAFTGIDRVFQGSSAIQKIDELVLRSDGKNYFDRAFQGCSGLMDITISGMIGGNISFSDSSKLTPESVDSIITALQQLETGAAAKTLTLHATVKSKMTDSQKAIIQEKGWTLA